MSAEFRRWTAKPRSYGQMYRVRLIARLWSTRCWQHTGGLISRSIMPASAAKGSTVLIDQGRNAEAFYLKMGAVRVGEVRSEIDGQPRSRPLLHLRLATPARW